MRTLFGLIPFYGGGEGPMDQMVKSTLASVKPNTIDVRDQEGNTLLILACQHACDDLVDAILTKGADPLSTNGVGISPLHYACYVDSSSRDTVEALLWRGADTSVTETTYGCTPLHYAAGAGDEELCTLLLEYGADPRIQDYYGCTPVQYARSASHDAVASLLGGDDDLLMEDGEGFVGYTDGGELGGVNGGGYKGFISGGLWVRNIDPETGLAYHMNDETGESWWETDLTDVARDFLATTKPNGDGETKGDEGGAASVEKLPPGVREWLLQQQLRSCLINLFSRADPLRLTEVDLLMEREKGDFKGMLHALLERYGGKEFASVKEGLMAKLDALGAASIMPLVSDGPLGAESGSDDEEASVKVMSACPGASDAQHSELRNAQTPPSINSPLPNDKFQVLDPESLDFQGVQNSFSSLLATGTTTSSSTTALAPPKINSSGATTNGSGVAKAAGLLRRVDTAFIRAEGERKLQEKLARLKQDLGEEREKQKESMQEKESAIKDLEQQLKKREDALAKAREEAREHAVYEGKAELQAQLADGQVGQSVKEKVVEDIARLKGAVAGERAKLSHINEALEAMKGTVEERAEKQAASEAERQARLESLRAQGKQELESIREDFKANNLKTEEEWRMEREELEEGLTKQVDEAKALLKETKEGAAQVLEGARGALEKATEEAQQVQKQTEEAQAWMALRQEEHGNARKVEQANRQLNTSLRREMERAKQARFLMAETTTLPTIGAAGGLDELLHNQLVDMKGQARVYARVRPMNEHEKSASCKEVCLKDGKQTLALLTGERQHWDYTLVFQSGSSEADGGLAQGQTELHQEMSSLGTSLADGHNVLLLASGAARSGKSLTLIGDPEEAKEPGGFFMPEVAGGKGPEGDGGCGEGAGSGAGGAGERKSKKGKASKGGNGHGSVEGVARVKSRAGLLPRITAEVFATLTNRQSQCHFTVSFSAVSVSAGSAPSPPQVRCLLPPSAGLADTGASGVGGDGATTCTGRSDDTRGGERKEAGMTPSGPTMEDSLWKRSVQACTAAEVASLMEAARVEGGETAAGMAWHLVSRVLVRSVNHCTKEVLVSELVMVELAEEVPGSLWAKRLASAVQAHASAAVPAGTSGSVAAGEDPLLQMVEGCLRDTGKVVTLLCVSPADSQVSATESVLRFGDTCKATGEGGASQLRELKKELARLKKSKKGGKKQAPSQLPRPAGAGKRA
ncbi:unnamed protein product [Discosporangium mesarthrocarpum]